MTTRSILRSAGVAVLLAVMLWFFKRELERHWLELQHVRMDLHLPWIAGATVLAATGYLLATAGWRMSILLASGRRLTFIECVGLVNISQLTKYLPGKVWSYAIQMHLLAARGIPKTVVLSVNAIMLASLASSATAAGAMYLCVSHAMLPREISLALLAGSLAFYGFLVFGGAWSVNTLVRVANRFLRRRLQPLAMPLRGSLAVHGLYLASNLLFGISGYLVAVGLGMEQDLSVMLPIAGSMLLSDTIGFFAFVLPGGIGVREGVMYAMLKSSLDIRICFMLPVAFRLVTTISDLLLGGVALLVLNRFKASA